MPSAPITTDARAQGEAVLLALRHAWDLLHCDQRQALIEVDALLQGLDPDDHRRHALWVRCIAAWAHAGFAPQPRHLAMATEAEAGFAALAEAEGMAFARICVATVMWTLGRAEQARAHLAQADLAAALQSADGRVAFTAHLGLLPVAVGVEDLAAALRHASSARQAALALGDAPRLALALSNLAALHMAFGHYAGAESMYADSLALARRHQLDTRLGGTLPALVMCRIAQQRVAEALPLVREWLQHHHRPGSLDTHNVYGTLVAVRCLAEQDDRLDEAAALLDALCQTWQPQWSGDAAASHARRRLMLAWVQAQLLRRQGRPAQALQALDAGQAFDTACESLFVRADVHRQRLLCHQQLGQWQAACEAAIAWGERQRRLLDGAQQARLSALAVERDLDAERLARERAEAQARLKAELLASMSHEIRTPLNVVIGLARLLQQPGSTDGHGEHAARIERAGQTVLAMVNDILDASKIEAGRLALEDAGFALEEVLDDLRTVLGQRAADKGVEFLFQQQPGVPARLQGDPLRLGQVLINLVSNAINFTPPGGEVTLAILPMSAPRATEPAPPPTPPPAPGLPPAGRSWLRFAITDTGIGLTAEQQARLFEPYAQAEASTSRRFGGTGLGLSISKRLVDLMGGRLGLVSQPGQGSTFWCDLPLVATQASDEVPAVAAVSLPGPLRVLVVDDHVPTCALVAALLQQLAPAGALQVEACVSADEALARLRHANGGGDPAGRPFGLILVDAHLPRHAAQVLTATVHVDDGIQPRPRLLMLDTVGRDPGGDPSPRQRADQRLCKPVSLHSLQQALQRLFELPARALPGDRPRPARRLVAVDQAPSDGPCVLLVDDDPVNQLVSQALLRDRGLRVDCVGDGRQAIDAVLGRPPGHYLGVLMDLDLPRLGGLEATRAIRRSAPHADLPIVAFTAHSDDRVLRACLDAGMWRVVGKPLGAGVVDALLLQWARRLRCDVAAAWH